MTVSLPRRILAELLGTALLAFFGPGAVVAALTLGKGSLDYAGLGFIALSFGLVVALVIYTLGTTSGAHINPAVTVALAVTGRFRWVEVPAYVGAQVVGAVLGAFLMVGVAGTKAATAAGVGLTSTAPGVSNGQAVLAEGVGTFLLMFTIMAVAVDRRAPVGWAGFLIGLAVVCEIVVIGPFTGGSVNPARTIGPYLANTMSGGTTPWGELWIYVVGPVVGAALAAFVYDRLVQPDLDDAHVVTEEPGAASDQS
ncbi:MAG: aquaporin family protein [Kineosporiaceae bacterium]|nr:aquaporin family protein [Aeromicrobium sp.]